MFKLNHKIRFGLIIIFLVLANCVLCNTLIHKNKSYPLKYERVNQYSVIIAEQDVSLKESHIEIPSEIEFNDSIFNVIGIKNNAFSGNKHLKKVTFQENGNIEYIGEGAFAGCENLIEIELPSTIKENTVFLSVKWLFFTIISAFLLP